MRKGQATIALVPLIIACAEPRVDGSSLAACDVSIAEVARSTEDSVAFAMAYAALAMRGAFSGFESSLSSAFTFDDDAASVSFAELDTTTYRAELCQILDGLRAPEIIANADSLGGELIRVMEVSSAEAKIEPLRAAREAYSAALDSMRRFEVLSASLVQTRGVIGLETVVTLRVHNGTRYPVSRAYFRGRATTPGRAVPWIEEEFNYSIPGGVEPGEEATWRLQPNVFQGAWSSVSVPAEARFQVEVTGLDGPDGDGLWGRPRFTSGDSILLDSLSRRFAIN